MFVDWCFVQAFGQVVAKQLIVGGFSAYTPTSARYYKNKGQYHSDARVGDQIFFHNSTRIYHTGIVTKVTAKTVYTIEGNTSSGPTVIANGGAVCEKSYALTNTDIDGYGRPDWSIVERPSYAIGWTHDSNGWKNINSHKYYFNSDGYAVTDWQKIDEKWYYFEPTAGHPLECALYVSDSMGVQEIGTFN